MPETYLLGYTLETIVAEKLETVVKRGQINTRMKDFFDLWTILSIHEMEPDRLKNAIQKVFVNRKTEFKYPIAFTPAFYNSEGVNTRWNNFIATMGKEPVEFKEVIQKIDQLLDFSEIIVEDGDGNADG